MYFSTCICTGGSTQGEPDSGVFLKKGSTQRGFPNRGLTLEINPSLFAEINLSLLRF